MISYAAAAISSVVLALFLRRLMKSSALRLPGNQILFNSTTSFIALAGAGFVNAVVMRSWELQRGVRVFDEQDRTLGYSRKAAWQAVMQTAYSRIFLAFQTVFLPGIVIGLMNNRGLMPRGIMLRSVSELSILAAMMYVGLPASIAMFSQKGRITGNMLE